MVGLGTIPECTEEVFELLAALFLFEIWDDLASVVESGIIAELIECAHGTGFGVWCAIDQSSDPGVDDQPGAHRAWFEGNDEGAVIEPPVGDGLASLDDGVELGVPCGVVVHLAGVVGRCEYLARRGVVDDRTYGHLAEC